MSRTNAFLFVIFAFSSISFGASLMQRSMIKSTYEVRNSAKRLQVFDIDQSCRQLIKQHHQKTSTKIAEELYREAFSLNFNGEWQTAQAASKCAARLTNGSEKWRIDAKSFIH